MPLDFEGINKLVKEYEGETKALKDELLRLCWFMRGGISYTEAHNLDTEERQLIAKIIDKNIQTTKESGLPFF